MKGNKKTSGLLFISALFLFAGPLFGQYQIKNGVFGSGGAPVSGSLHRLTGTAGQGAIGSSGDSVFTAASGFWAQEETALTGIGISRPETLPDQFRLEQNYPNPFNPETTISFAVSEACEVSIEIIDIRGRVVGKPLREKFSPGFHKIVYDGRALSSGVYFYRMRTTTFNRIRKMIILK